MRSRRSCRMNHASRTCIRGWRAGSSSSTSIPPASWSRLVSRSAAFSRRSCSRHSRISGRATEHRRVRISSAVIASGRTRLTVLGMAPDEIDAIEQSGEPRRLVTVVARERRRRESRVTGTSVDPSTTLLTIADLSRVWVLGRPRQGHSGIRVDAPRLDFPASGAGGSAVWTSSIRRSPTARARCASASRRPIRAAARTASMERRLNRRDRS